MGNLSNLYISQSFQSLAHLGTNNALVPGTMTQLEDGIGQSLNISFDGTNISSSGNIFAANLTGSANTGSFMLTGSVSVNVLTFTKADGSTFNLTVAASGSVVPGTISGSAQITALGFVSSSVTASSLITASFDNNTRNLTFTKGNNTTFNVNIPDVSGSTFDTGSLVTTSSFNSYTQSTNIRLNNLETTSASVNISISNLNSTTASQATSITNLNSATQSLFSSASLSLTTASFSGNTLTFTKGNGTTFGVVIPDVSGSGATPTGSLLVTASAFINTITFTKGDGTTFPVTVTTGSLNYVTGSFGAFYDTTTQSGSAGVAYSMKLNNTDISDGVIISGSGGIKVLAAGTYDLQFSAQVLAATGADTVWIWLKKNGTNVADTSTKLVLRNNEADVAAWNFVVAANANDVFELAWQSSGGHVLLFAEAAASNYTAIPSVIATMNRVDVGGGTNLVSTASFNSYTSSTNTRLTNIESTTASLNTSASLALVTASFDNGTRNLTFTKGNTTTFAINIPAASGSTIDTGSFATTGSNTFVGNQIISGTITTTQDITVSSVKFGFGNSAGTSSIAIGNSSTLANNTDDNNIAIGYDALNQNTTGERNIGIGTQALTNIRGNSSYNTAIGAFTLSSATSSTNTFALGYAAMELAETSTENIAIGVAALYRKKANSNSNTAIGSGALREHYDGDTNSGQNLAIGLDAMRNVTSGSANTAIGAAALRDAPRANENTFIGWTAGINAGTIDNSTVIGARAGTSMKSGNNTLIGHSAGYSITSGSSNTLIGKGAGYDITTGSNNTLIGTNTGNANWNNVIALSDGATNIRAIYNSDWAFTGSVDIQNTLTASLQQGFTYVGNASGRTVAVSTSSFASTIDTGSFATTGSNSFTGIQTFVNGTNFSSLVPTSGSLMLVAKSFTSASLHLSSSFTNSVNLIFKNNDNTADTIISGSNNIFVNATAPTAGFKRYIGGNNNIYNTLTAPQISGSMGISPNMTGNIGPGTYIFRGPVSSSSWVLQTNYNAGTVNIGSSAANNAEKLVSGYGMTGNNILGTLNIIANQSTLSSSVLFNNNFLAGTATLNLSSSAVQMSNNIINETSFALTNQYYSGSTGAGITQMNRTIVNGSGNTVLITGILDVAAGTAQPNVVNNTIGGASNTIFVNATSASTSHNLQSTIIYGNTLIVSASSISATTSTIGSAFFGRFNANDGIRNKSAQNIFVVGTGTSTSATKTGFLIDSGSNVYVEGSLNISGTAFLNGVSIAGVNTGSFATTGSNTFVGNEVISGSLSIRGNTTFTSVSGITTNVILGSNAAANSVGVAQSVIIGQDAMQFASGSSGNIAIGIGALKLTSGSSNFGLGTYALTNNTSGDTNLAIGTGAGYYNTTGNRNIFIGFDAGANTITGSSNTFIGAEAGADVTGSSNTIIGRVRGDSSLESTIIIAAGTVQKLRHQNNIFQVTGSIAASAGLSALGEFKLASGTDKPAGIVSVNSSLTVTNSLVTTNSIILVTTQNGSVGGVEYAAVVMNKGTGTFDIVHDYGGTLSVGYLIINPA